MFAPLQGRHEQGVGSHGADAWVMHRWPHREPPRQGVTSTPSRGSDTLGSSRCLTLLGPHKFRVLRPAGDTYLFHNVVRPGLWWVRPRSALCPWGGGWWWLVAWLGCLAGGG